MLNDFGVTKFACQVILFSDNVFVCELPRQSFFQTYIHVHVALAGNNSGPVKSAFSLVVSHDGQAPLIGFYVMLV